MKFNSKHSDLILPKISVFLIGLTIAIIIRFALLTNNSDTGTANLFFILALAAYFIFYLLYDEFFKQVFIFFGNIFKSKKNIHSSEMDVTESEAEVFMDDRDTLNPILITEKSGEISNLIEIEARRKNWEKERINLFNTNLEKFQNYTRIIFSPHVDDHDLKKLAESILIYSNGDKILDSVSVKTHHLTKMDLFHFGWNMVNHFKKSKQEVAPWLKLVFSDLKDLELSSITKKLKVESEKGTIKIIEDIPKYMENM
jgi:uncharacterized membrane protein YobD (UPF0266 family)